MQSGSLGGVAAAVLLAACGGAKNSAGSSSELPQGGNVLSVSVNGDSGALCSPATGYPNEPCVSLDICQPGSSNCVTVPDVLLDTGSVGLRLFQQVLGNLALPAVSVNGQPLAECVQYGDGSGDWGPIETAVVQLGNDSAGSMPIQVIDSTYTGSSNCGNNSSNCQLSPATPVCLDVSPEGVGFNGILGVGLWEQDCGSACDLALGTNGNNPGWYYTCEGSSCSQAVVPLEQQVQNPVRHLQSNNNGLILTFESVPAGGLDSASGVVVFGIGSQANNGAGPAVQSYALDQNGDFRTIFAGNTYDAIVDTGSNGLFFPSAGVSSQVPFCTASQVTTWYCPPTTVSLSATNGGFGNSANSTVAFQIANFETSLQAQPKLSVFPDIGGSPLSSTGPFDWGLPFFFGRSIYICIENQSCLNATGPFIAY